jgi:hypothetical protein
LKLADQLPKEVKSKLNQIKSPKKVKQPEPAPKPKKEEKINWHDLMGSNRQILKRGKGGAWK